MRSEQQHIDDYFRKKEEEYQADTGNADVNWEQMRGLLKPGIDPVPKNIRLHATRRIIKYVGGFTVVTVLTLVTITAIKSKKKPATTKAPAAKTMATPEKKQPAAQPLAASKKAPAQPVKKAAPLVTHTAPVKVTPHRMPSTKPATITGNLVKQTKATSDNARETIKGSPPPTDHSPLPIAQSSLTISSREVTPDKSSLTIEPAASTNQQAAQQIEAFYKQIQQPGQQFIVDVTKETVLTGKEGTTLKIPAQAFANIKGLIKEGTVTIVLREYYTYDDILAAKISTTSGEEQLISGGMVRVTAEKDGREVRIAAGKTINLEMPTQKYDDQMKLFRGVRSSLKNAFQAKFMDNRMIDTVRFLKREADENGDIDWIPEGQEQQRKRRIDPYNTLVKVFDPYGDPYQVSHGKKITARFYVSKKCPLSNTEVKAKLLERSNGYFDKVKLKRVNAVPLVNYQYWEDRISIVGDTVEMTMRQALRKKILPLEDSLRVMEKYRQDSANLDALEQNQSKYSFKITSLGWINCDKFNNRSPKVLFAFKPAPGFEPNSMVSHLVFTNYRSVMPGKLKDNKINFGRVPKDEPVKFVSIGVKDGKVMACIQELTTDRDEIKNLVYEETTPEQFKAKLEKLKLILP